MPLPCLGVWLSSAQDWLFCRAINAFVLPCSMALLRSGLALLQSNQSLCPALEYGSPPLRTGFSAEQSMPLPCLAVWLSSAQDWLFCRAINAFALPWSMALLRSGLAFLQSNQCLCPALQYGSPPLRTGFSAEQSMSLPCFAVWLSSAQDWLAVWLSSAQDWLGLLLLPCWEGWVLYLVPTFCGTYTPAINKLLLF